LATLASDTAVAQLAMQPGSNTVQALLQLITTSDDDAFAGNLLLPPCSWCFIHKPYVCVQLAMLHHADLQLCL